MNARDLRIGNIVFDKRVSAHAIERFDAGFMDLKPVHLTSEWLERFGFKKGDNVTCSDSFYEIPVGGSMLSINPDNGVVWITRNRMSINNPALIEYVHQLQNLYFALTGSELQLKDKTV